MNEMARRLVEHGGPCAYAPRRTANVICRLVRFSRVPILPRESVLPDPELFALQTNYEQSSHAPFADVHLGYNHADQ